MPDDTAGAVFTRMDRSTAEEWTVINAESMKHDERMADRVLRLLRSLEQVQFGFTIDQLSHSLQTATRAERDGADTELVIAALCHDVGKAISLRNHPAIAAELLRPYVRHEVCEVIRLHQDFQGRHYYGYFGKDPNAREAHRTGLGPKAFDLAEHFADEWDQVSFDPDYDSYPLAHFEARLRETFAAPRPTE